MKQQNNKTTQHGVGKKIKQDKRKRRLGTALGLGWSAKESVAVDPSHLSVIASWVCCVLKCERNRQGNPKKKPREVVSYNIKFKFLFFLLHRAGVTLRERVAKGFVFRECGRTAGGHRRKTR